MPFAHIEVRLARTPEEETAIVDAVHESLVDCFHEHDLRIRLQREPRGDDHLLEHPLVRACVACDERVHGPRQRGDQGGVCALDPRVEGLELAGEDAGGEGMEQRQE